MKIRKSETLDDLLADVLVMATDMEPTTNRHSTDTQPTGNRHPTDTQPTINRHATDIKRQVILGEKCVYNAENADFVLMWAEIQFSKCYFQISKGPI